MLPAAVSSLRRPTRSSRGTPSSSSSCFTALLTVGCVAKTTLAARENPPCLTTSTKSRSLRKSMSILIWNGVYVFNSFYSWISAVQNSTLFEDSALKNTIRRTMPASDVRTGEQGFRHALRQAGVALLVISSAMLAPQRAFAASSAGCVGGGFSVLGLSGDQRTIVAAGKVDRAFLVKGKYIEFTVDSIYLPFTRKARSTLPAATIVLWSPESPSTENPPPTQPADEAAKARCGASIADDIPRSAIPNIPPMVFFNSLSSKKRRILPRAYLCVK